MKINSVLLSNIGNEEGEYLLQNAVDKRLCFVKHVGYNFEITNGSNVVVVNPNGVILNKSDAALISLLCDNKLVILD